MPKVNPHADPTRRDLGPAALGRTVKKLFSYYPVLAPVTFVCILFSSIVSSVPSLFTQNIIQIIEKWYISRDWAAAKAEIVPYLTLLVVLYALSILSMTVYTQLMAYMTQGFLHKLRCEMFGGMQKLPIRYFDSHQHGDIMSHYTNDIDTLRQLVSQALPALIQSGAIVLVVFSIMLYFSLWLTLVLVLGIIAMVAVTKKIGGGSAKYFVRQQKAVASTEGFIQEMMAGQKVVKVFCHEQKSIEDFDRLNDALFEDSFRAQAYASVLGPIIGNIGNILYVTLALVGGVFLLIGLPNVSLSGKALDISILVPFLNMARQFTGNVNQLSQQINAVVMAGAGAQRVFALIDEKPETDDGYVTLVNAEIAPDGTVTESDRRTGHWAWKHPHGDGTLTYTELQRRRAPHRRGLRLRTEGKDVLHDVSVYAEPGPEGRLCRRDRRGQDDHHEPHQPLLRHCRRQDPLRRHQHQQDQEGGSAPLSRHRFAGDEPLHRHGDGEHPLRHVWTRRTRSASRRRSSPTRTTSSRACREGYDTHARPTTARTSRRASASCIAIARAAVADPPVMILDEATSSIDTRTEAHRAARHGRADGGPHGLRHRAPSVHRQELRRHHGPRPRPHHRARQPRKAHRREGHLLSALHRRVRAGISRKLGAARAAPVFSFLCPKGSCFFTRYAIMTSTNVPSGSLPGRCFLSRNKGACYAYGK